MISKLAQTVEEMHSVIVTLQTDNKLRKEAAEARTREDDLEVNQQR